MLDWLDLEPKEPMPRENALPWMLLALGCAGALVGCAPGGAVDSDASSIGRSVALAGSARGGTSGQATSRSSASTSTGTASAGKGSATVSGTGSTTSAGGGGACGGSPLFCDEFANGARSAAYTTYHGTWTRNAGNYSVADAVAWERARATGANFPTSMRAAWCASRTW